MATGFNRFTNASAGTESSFGTAASLTNPINLAYEGDGHGFFPEASFSEVQRVVGSSEAPEQLDSAYDVRGNVRCPAYALTVSKILEWAFSRSSGETYSRTLFHQTGLGNALQVTGVKVDQIAFSAEKGNPALIMDLALRGQIDASTTSIAAPTGTNLPDARVFEFIRGYLELRNDQTPGGTQTVVDALGFSVQVLNNLTENGRKPNIEGNPADPTKWQNIVTGLSAGVSTASGSFRFNPTDETYLTMIRNLTKGSAYLYFVHRDASAVSLWGAIAAGATTMAATLPASQAINNGDILVFRAGRGGASLDVVEAVRVSVGSVASSTGAQPVSFTIQGRASNGGFRYAWPATSTTSFTAARFYTLGLEIVIPGLRVSSGPLRGGPRDIISQEINWVADALAGAAAIKVGAPRSALDTDGYYDT